VPNTTLSGATRPCPGPASAPNWLRGKTIIVTGAGSGLGAAVAQVLGAEGAAIVLADIAFERARERAALLAERDVRTLALALDVGDETQVRRVVAQTRERFGRIDALVNSAAIDNAVPLAELLGADWERLLRANLSGPFYAIHSFLPKLKAAHGTVVIISSVSGAYTDRSGPAYQASKGGVIKLSHGAGFESGGDVRFTVILPGVVDTDILDNRPEPPTRAVRDQMLHAEDVAAACVFAVDLPPRAFVAELTILPTALQAIGKTL